MFPKKEIAASLETLGVGATPSQEQQTGGKNPFHRGFHPQNLVTTDSKNKKGNQ
jgi:hypothetical protein